MPLHPLPSLELTHTVLVAVVCMDSKKKVVNDSFMHESTTNSVCVLTSSVSCATCASYSRSLEDEVREVLIAGLLLNCGEL